MIVSETVFTGRRSGIQVQSGSTQPEATPSPCYFIISPVEGPPLAIGGSRNGRWDRLDHGIVNVMSPSGSGVVIRPVGSPLTIRLSPFVVR